MLQMFSIPTWFLTLSAADLHWPEMIQAVAVQFGQKLTQKDVQKMSRCYCQSIVVDVKTSEADVIACYILVNSLMLLPMHL